MEDWQIEERQSQMVNSLASDLIADIISARIRLDSFPNKFNIDDYWNDIKESVLANCQEKFISVKFLTDEEEN
tara:strand:- start:458 stop:676 length:219 start_codon:yes stop_codon:yes gene_type:complete